jgi:hypothetical protein
MRVALFKIEIRLNEVVAGGFFWGLWLRYRKVARCGVAMRIMMKGLIVRKSMISFLPLPGPARTRIKDNHDLYHCQMMIYGHTFPS